jgi:hypothetical protein
VSKTTFINDLNARVREAERIIAEQNENLAALRHLLGKETGPTEAMETAAATPEPIYHQAPADLDFKGKTSDIILTLVQRSGEGGTRPRDIAEILLAKKLITKGSNAVHSHLNQLKGKGLVKQNAEGLYVTSSKSVAAKPVNAAAPSAPAKKAQKKRRLSAEGREAIRKAQKARWAAVNKAKG